MCGIAGFNATPNETKIDALRLSRALLRAIESRGRHAAGAAWTEEGGVWWDKAPVPGSVYAKRLPMSPLASQAILHTRYATTGDPKVNGNNHPFSLPGITGIHNGIITNHRAIFDLLGVERTAPGGTDSEAIFALLAHSGLAPTSALELLEGDAAVAWIETDAPDRLHLARLEGRPLAVGKTPAGSTVFASTMPLLRLGCHQAGVLLQDAWSVPEWTYMTIDQGAITSVERFGEHTEKATLLGGDDDDWADTLFDPRDHVPSVLRRSR